MSDKVRVYEIAEESGASSSKVIAKAKDLGIELKTSQSAVSIEDAEEIANYIMTGKSRKLPKVEEKKKVIKRKEVYRVHKVTKNDTKKLFKTSKLIIVKSKYSADLKIVSNNIKDNLIEKELELSEISENVRDMSINEKREDFILNSYPSVTIEIKNLKTIKNLKWELQKEVGVYAIIGENGSGKSSLLISIAKLIEPNIFHLELTGTGYYEKTEINYIINNKEFTWIKNKSTNNNWRQSSQDKYNMPNKIKGFFESSILTGTRFDKVDEYIKNELDYRKEDIVEEGSAFIRNAMNYILFGNRINSHKFKNLFKVNAVRKRRNSNNSKNDKITYSDKNYSYYALGLNNDEYIKEHLFSTGEYFLLKILKFIDNFKNLEGSIIPSLIVIDEVELSLHPLAQVRLTEQLKVFSKRFNLIILFASHSLHILENIDADKTFFIQKDDLDNHIITNPVHFGYLTSKLYKHQFYDKVILVEDELAKMYMEHTLNDMAHRDNFSLAIIIAGGSSQVVKIAIENNSEKFYGDADLMVSLDEDKKEDCYRQKRYIKWSHHIPVFKNIENYVKILIKDGNLDFIKFIESILIKSSFYELKIDNEGDKSGFKTLVAEIATNVISRHYNNKDNSKDYAKKMLVSHVYNCHKNLEKQNDFVKELERFFT